MQHTISQTHISILELNMILHVNTFMLIVEMVAYNFIVIFYRISGRKKNLIKVNTQRYYKEQ